MVAFNNVAFLAAAAFISTASAQVTLPGGAQIPGVPNPLPALTSVAGQVTSAFGVATSAIAGVATQVAGAATQATSAAGAAATTVAGDCPVFDLCKSNINIATTSTCDPLQKTNVTWYADCECRFAVNMKNCYSQCPGNAKVEAEGVAYQTKVVALCAAANLDANHLPPTAPWIISSIAVPTATATAAGNTVAAPAITATSVASAAATATPSAGANSEGYTLGGLTAIVPIVGAALAAVLVF
ncbi:uncharacterized protein EV422DRAFT_515413 [Fimicolochytrium jonesii]|uniref:uncharacterized protein n=1 Tax=Fimicolochytrium jonesii TaxID=1396493 RepID=UPI0022FDFD12|nr:uncharacterized protein EV422DRAFT_515413 [Fimicolochytrium jonesii]KAI8826116.1 hypothetical protein EV422DRAFT_515413 [Fimicolochytrium jonesii]